MLDSILEALSPMLESSVAAPIAAFLAGVITSLTPCSLSQVPLVLGYVGREARPGKAFRLALVYAVGSAVTFTAFGIAASLFGMLLGAAFSWWYIALGIIMLLMAMQIWGIISIAPSTYLAARNTLIAMIAASESTVRGALLMLLYSAGCTALSVALGASPSLIRRIGQNEGMRKASKALSVLLGCGVFAIGIVLLYLGF